MATFKNERKWQEKLHEVIYESGTPAGKAFDVALLVIIVVSIITVMLDSVPIYHDAFGDIFFIIEWVLTIIFTIEYILRLLSIKQPLKYFFSFLGIVDLLSIVPTYLSFFFAGTQSLLVVRSLRLLRIFRIFKLNHYVNEMQFLMSSMSRSIRKISIFLFFVLTVVVILGSIMYLVESPENGFTSIPQSIYWAVVTITTVGYGDISPVTPIGKFVACIIMLLGYGIIAVPTGIVTTEMALAAKSRHINNNACPNCGKEGHDDNANFCKFCGEKL